MAAFRRSIRMEEELRPQMTQDEHLRRVAGMNVLAVRHVPEVEHPKLNNSKGRVRDFAIQLVQAIYHDIDMFHAMARAKVTRRHGHEMISKTAFQALCHDYIEHFKELIADEEGVPRSPTEPRPALSASDSFVPQLSLALPPGPGARPRPKMERCLLRPVQFPLLASETISFEEEHPLRHRLADLFAAMDTTDVQEVKWEACIGYLMDACMQGHVGAQANPIKPYVQADGIGTRHENKGVHVLKYLPHLDVCVVGGERSFAYLHPKTLSARQRYPAPTPVEGRILALEWVPDTKVEGLVVVTTSAMSLRFYRDRSAVLHHSIPLETSQFCVRYSPRWESSLFTGAQSGYLSTWRFRPDQEVVAAVRLHDSPVTDIVPLPGNDVLVTCGMDAGVVLYEPRRAQVLRRFTIGTGVYSMRFCGDYGYLITGGYSPEPLLWVLNGGAKCDPFQLLDEDRPHSGALVGVEVVEGTPQVLSLDCTGLLKVWDIRQFRCVQSLKMDHHLTKAEAEQWPQQMLAYLPRQKQIVTSTRCRMYCLQYNPDSNGVPTVTDDGPVSDFVFNGSTNTFLTISGSNVRTWDVRTGQLSDSCDAIVREQITALCLDVKGRRFFLGTYEGWVYVHNHSNNLRLHAYKIANCEVSALAYAAAATGKSLLVAATYRGRVLVMVEEPERRARFRPLWNMFSHSTDGMRDIDAKCLAYDPLHGNLLIGDTRNFVTVVHVDHRNATFRLLGQPSNPDNADPLKIANQEVTALAVIPGHHAFVCAETSGYIAIFTVPPGHPPNRCVARFLPPYAQIFHGAVAALTVSEAPLTLWTGDDHGYVCGFDLEALVEQAGLAGPPARATASASRAGASRLASSFGAALEQRQGSTQFGQLIDSLALSAKAKPRGSLQQIPGAKRASSTASATGARSISLVVSAALAAEAEEASLEAMLRGGEAVRVRDTWRAHDQRIHRIVFLPAYRVLVTCSADRHVLLWRPDGTLVGGLEQQNYNTYDLDRPPTPPSCSPRESPARTPPPATKTVTLPDLMPRSEGGGGAPGPDGARRLSAGQITVTVTAPPQIDLPEAAPPAAKEGAMPPAGRAGETEGGPALEVGPKAPQPLSPKPKTPYGKGWMDCSRAASPPTSATESPAFRLLHKKEKRQKVYSVLDKDGPVSHTNFAEAVGAFQKPKFPQDLRVGEDFRSGPAKNSPTKGSPTKSRAAARAGSPRAGSPPYMAHPSRSPSKSTSPQKAAARRGLLAPVYNFPFPKKPT